MLAGMESNQEATLALAEAERAAAAPWIEYPPTPRWYPFAVGLWAAAYCLSFAIPDGMLRTLVLLPLIISEFWFIIWARKYRGVWPNGKPPIEIRALLIKFVIGAVLVVGLGALAIWLVGPWVSAIYAVVVVTLTVAWYERAYAVVADRARKRLG